MLPFKLKPIGWFPDKLDLEPLRASLAAAIARDAYVLVRASFPIQHAQAHYACGRLRQVGRDFLHLDVAVLNYPELSPRPLGIPTDWLQQVHILTQHRPKPATLRRLRMTGPCIGISA